ncbi:hypothetical protein J437_LFUL000147 [Ladona fulva]|uniref:Uncharacterized protein n=1 Tax=Ladona fulva TaxID=123851 RepID=A0A8K0KC52_LADFU|nr:hypothetical protein J437_LFUL000147 [Ladona fulva]
MSDRSSSLGIMQLALLAPLGVGAAGGGSGLALLPRALIAAAPPKIRITDEHERTFSLASSAGPASAAATPATPATPLPPPRPHSAPYGHHDNGHEGDVDEEVSHEEDVRNMRIFCPLHLVTQLQMEQTILLQATIPLQRYHHQQLCSVLIYLEQESITTKKSFMQDLEEKRATMGVENQESKKLLESVKNKAKGAEKANH